MFHLYRVLAVLILFTVQSHAYVDFINELEFNAETSSLTHNDTEEGKCRLDLLILLDMSKSIGSSFDNNVKPFLKNLIGNDQLNVGPDGTHVSLILFSNKEDTKVAFKFGEYSTRESLQKYFANLEYDVDREARTYTGEALKKANNEVFKEKSPGNHRPHVGDVLLLITDGEPNGEGNGKETDIAINEATKLRGIGIDQKSVTIIGVAVLRDSEKSDPDSKKYNTVKKIVGSVERTMTVTFKELDNNRTIDDMVDMLCLKIVKCGDHDYDPSKQKCCCGKLWSEMKSGHTCCGHTYINSFTDHCCDQETASYVANGESCD